MSVRPWWDGLLGRIRSNGSDLKLAGALEFIAPLTAANNPATGAIEVRLEAGDGITLPIAAEDVSYDNAATGLPADNVQEAIDIFAKFTEIVLASTISGGSFQPTSVVTLITLDVSLVVTITASRTGVFRLVFQQDAVGGHTVELNGIAGWPSGVAYVPTAAPYAIDIVDLTSLQGTTYANVLGYDYSGDVPFVISEEITEYENGVDGIVFNTDDSGFVYGTRVGTQVHLKGLVNVTYSTSVSGTGPKVLKVRLPFAPQEFTEPSYITGSAHAGVTGTPLGTAQPFAGSFGFDNYAYLYAPRDMPNGAGVIYFDAIYEYHPPE